MTALLRPLTPVEARVLGTLMEKARTVPDSYPLSMQALLTGCNQKTTRDPVMNLTEAQAAEAVGELKDLSLVIEQSGARVPRYSHNFMRGIGVPEQSAVLLGLLMLRGPQTAGELRINSERLHAFSDISAVEAFLEELASRPAGALVREAARQPGARETRWAHLLAGGPPSEPSPAAAHAAAQEPSLGEIAALKANVDRLEGEVAELREKLARVFRELGL